MRFLAPKYTNLFSYAHHEAKAKTAYGEVKLKICEKNGIVYRYPEYESVKKLCEAAGVPFKVVYQAACEAEISE